ncbi:MAG: ECF transporter S component [Oscillospiraceae bacterium]|nr:ECF transporter S component [Oscillospiraceae bacterium]
MQNQTKRMATNAMLAALCAVLGFVSIDMGNLKITLESFPVNLGALLFGPVDGMVIAFLGSFIYQILKYGFSVTTLLWILPGVVSAALLGGYAKKKEFGLTRKQVIIAVLIAELVVTILNTGVMYIDSKIYGYYSFVYIFGTIVPRFAICIGKGVVYGAVLHPLMETVKKAIKLN